MKEEDNTEGRKIRPAFLSLSLLFRTKGKPWHAGLSDLSARQLAMGGKGEMLLYAPFCLADSSRWLREGERKQRENKMRVFNGEPETFVIKMEMRLFVDEGISASHCLSCQPSERLL